MTELKEMQFEILPTEDAAEGYAFGIGLEVSVDNNGFSPGTNEWITQNGQNPRRGNTDFGRDVLAGGTWGWDLHVDQSDVPSALEALGRIATAWRGDEIVDTPGAVLAVRYRMGDRVRRVYGRPRRFSAPPSNRILSGFVPVTTDFECVDSYTYDDEASQAILTSATSTPSGFLFPVTFPVTTMPPADRSGRITVGGDADAYPVIRIDGPISNPYVETDDWRMDLKTSLTAQDYVIVDLRPWHLTALKNGSIPVELGRRQWFSDMYLRPGNRNIVFGGSATAGGATCAVSWRNTWNSI